MLLMERSLCSTEKTQIMKYLKLFLSLQPLWHCPLKYVKRQVNT